jgi:uncharacterized peroxidase-related enzyme
MAFIETVSPADATDAVRDMYERQQASYGYVPNYAKVFSHRPEVMARWARLLAEIRRPMSDRLFELATLAAALEFKNTACSLAHGEQLSRFISKTSICSMAKCEHPAELTDADMALVNFARKLAKDASTVNQRDVDTLKSHGYTDAEVFDISTTVAGRAFLTKILDALGVETDSTMNDMDPEFRQALTVGRPIATEAVEKLDSNAQ